MGKCLGENVTGNVCECLVACSVRGTTDTHTHTKTFNGSVECESRGYQEVRREGAGAWISLDFVPT